MIELNLLPDVKLEYIKTQRQRRLVISISVLVTVVAVVLLLLLLSIDGLQKKHLSDLNRDIDNESSQLQNEPNIDTILTVQNQLSSLTRLHDGKPAASQLFNYLNALTPASCSINNLSIDFTKETITITGTADALSSINQYVDMLKNATYTSNQTSGSQPAFSDVVLSNFSLNDGSQDKSQAASYTITLSYDQNIFNITENAKLTVPNKTLTRVSEQQPADLFKAAPAQPAAPTGGGSH